MDKKWIISIGILSVMIIAMIFVIRAGSVKKNPDNLPAYAFINDQVTEAYLYAKNNPEALDGVNCHCGCMQMQHDGRIHSRGLLDCFIKPEGEYDSHGANCKMCYVDALIVKKMTDQGKTKDEIKQFIDSKYI